MASLTPDEDDTLPTFAQQYAAHPLAVEASSIVQDYFAHETSVGVLRIQEGWERLQVAEMKLFLETLRRTFPGVVGT